MLVYTFVFSVVFKTRWGPGDESKADFAIVLFVGMIIHGLFAECLNRAPGLILNNVNYVKKVVFPLEILPWVAAGSALFHSAVSVTVLLAAQARLPTSAGLDSCFPADRAGPALAGHDRLRLVSILDRRLRARHRAHDWHLHDGIAVSVPGILPCRRAARKLSILLLLNPLMFVIVEARQVLIWGQAPDRSRPMPPRKSRPNRALTRPIDHVTLGQVVNADRQFAVYPLGRGGG
jgi:lipopolysaccharide transport system permease protein